MRNNLIAITTGLMLAGAFSSCSKSFLEQSNPNAVRNNEYFNTETDVALAVNGVYQALRSGNAVGETAGTWTDDRSDDVNTTDNQSNNGEPFQFTSFSLVPSNTYLLSHWTALYVPIARANFVLPYIDSVKFASETTRAQYKGEVKFIRAFMYFNLVREFGGVPLVLRRFNTLAEVAEGTYRETRENVYAQIITDLKDALGSSLPNVQPAASKGRVSLQAVNALLGQVYLTMAANNVGTKATNLENAKTYLLAAYNMRGFGKLAEIPFADVFDVNKKSTNQEIIWQIAYKQGDANLGSKIAANNQAKGETINSPVKSSGVGGTLTLDLLNEFETGDLRTNYSVKFAADPAVNAYFVTKFRDASAAATAQGYGGNDWILIRYADIILNLAELYQMLGDNATAITYLDLVRERAGRPNYATMMSDGAYAFYPTKYPTLKLAILHERRVELAFEHHRWHDLIRFFTPEELVAYFRTKKQLEYNNSPLSNITTKDALFPIPLNENKLNPEKMKQNPGYE